MPTPELPINNKKLIYQLLSGVIDRFFIVAVITYFFLFLVDTIWLGFVSANLNLTLFLFVVIISGVISSLLPFRDNTLDSAGDARGRNSVSKNGIWWVVVLGLLVSVVLFWITKQIGQNAIIVALAGGFIAAILAKLFILWED
ncbi:MAG: hypothetical protein WC734_01935 [Patescibacteria group bacterium]|jgi:hypothetical protein